MGHLGEESYFLRHYRMLFILSDVATSKGEFLGLFGMKIGSSHLFSSVEY